MVNRSAPPGPIVPVLPYKDVAKALGWLSAAFGFRERFRTPPEPDGTIHHAQLAVGEGAVILTGRPAADTRPLALNASLFVPVADVDAVCERARQFGARITAAPHTCPFGERQCTIEDLEDYLWTFSQSVADVAPEDWGAIRP
jgi:uncharacterized glyoxalase superfamily protein PhnB